MTFNMAATDFTVEDTSVTYDITMNISESVSCENADLDSLQCYEIIGEESTMTIGGTSYNSTQLCEMVDDDDCVL